VKALALIVLSGCFGVNDDIGPWHEVSTLTGPLAPEVGPAIGPRAAPSVLRVVSWNLHFGEDATGLAAAVANDPDLSRADVIFTQEIESYPEEAGSRASRMAGALGMTWVYAPGRIKDTGTHGIAIMSRFPIVEAEVRNLPHFSMPSGEESRIALAATLQIGDMQLRFVDVHLDVRLGASDRIRQLDPAVPDVGETQTVALGGDFNSAPWSWLDGAVPLLGTEAVVGQETPKLIDGYMGDLAWTTAIDPGTITLHDLPIRCDDLYSRNAILDSGSPRVDGSDHWPIWTDISLAASP
jgi:endonuclease/exonuclease/phosphatase family metal-dependent hydrolase